MKEFWKDIIGWEGLYAVSTTGLVKSYPKIVFNRSYKNNKKIYTKEKILKGFSHIDGYCFVRLCRPGKQKDFAIHRLIALTFIPNMQDSCCEVNHINGDRGDNRLENLEWVTPKQNTTHARDFLREGRPTGAKITVADVHEIVHLSKAGFSAIMIADIFKLHAASIRRIRRGATWKHLNLMLKDGYGN